jgi:hypothetical protein
MATTIKLKNGSGAPLAGDLVAGEPALDLTNKRLYTEDSGGTVIEVGTNPTSVTTGTFTSTGIDDNAASTAITIDGSQNVGIGASPSYNFHVTGTGDTIAAVTAGASSIAGLNLGNDTNKADGGIRYDNSADALIFRASNAEKMRIDASGNLLVGTTDAVVWDNSANSAADNGHNLRDDGRAGFAYYNATAGANATVNVNRTGSDGDLIRLFKSGTTVGSIGVLSSRFYIGSGDTGLKFSGADDLISPIDASDGTGRDNAIDLGSSGARFDDIYATNGTIQTSDRNEKQDIEALSDAEQRAAVAAKGLLRKFRWIDAVEEKGDDARIHFGIIAQDLQDAFTAEGLDAGRYAMFISTTWWESTEVIPAVEAQEAVVDEEGNVVEEAVEAQEERTVVHTHYTAEEAPEGSVERTRLGVRYSELLAFIIAAI